MRPTETDVFLDKCDVIATHGATVGEPLHQTPADLVQLLRIIRDTADSALPAAVEAMRRDGASWETVARWLGTSRQAAWERYGR